MPKAKAEPQDESLARIRELLEDGFVWPAGLEPMVNYSRLHDDHDGTGNGTLNVIIRPDGDAMVATMGERGGPILRFRNSFGGGMSLRVNNALKILALAIKLDNEERPIR